MRIDRFARHSGHDREDRGMRRDGIYTAILWILAADVVVGAILAVAGESLFGRTDISDFGFYMALVCGALYVFFRLLGHRLGRNEDRTDD
jgi:threonine/homoserine efflux transporter RhtA